MRALLLFNPVSGGGHAARDADRVAAALSAAGHEAELEPTRVDEDRSWLTDRLADRELLVVVGGDGAVRLSAQSAVHAGVLLYQFPAGTENLFAREWGMDRRTDTLLAAIARGDEVRADVATAGDELFLLMVSVGLDAEVVHDLAARRRGGISHLSYVGPVCRQLARFTPIRPRIEVDGVRVVDGEPGFLVAASSSQYALRLNPARRARMTDGLLHLVFYPAAGLPGALLWLARTAAGRHLRHPAIVHETGRTIEITADTPFLHQLDGDPGAVGPGSRLRLEIRPRQLRVLPGRMPREQAGQELRRGPGRARFRPGRAGDSTAHPQ